MSLPEPSWRSWLARQSHNLKVVSSSLTEGILENFLKFLRFYCWQLICKYLTLRNFFYFQIVEGDRRQNQMRELVSRDEFPHLADQEKARIPVRIWSEMGRPWSPD